VRIGLKSRNPTLIARSKYVNLQHCTLAPPALQLPSNVDY
jgi:hypothetical protein